MASIEIEMNWKTISGAIVSVLTIVGILIGGVYAAEERYVNLTELEMAQGKMVSDIQSLQKNLNEQRIKDRIQDYTDKKLDIKDKIADGTATAGDRRKLNRYNESIEQLQRDLDRLR